MFAAICIFARIDSANSCRDPSEHHNQRNAPESEFSAQKSPVNQMICVRGLGHIVSLSSQKFETVEKLGAQRAWCKKWLITA